MTISEMHVWFRQYAQQMGMQNVRAILPEQIDNLINTAIKDTVDEVINKSVGTTNDRVITDNAKLANINALRTLYRVKTYTPTGSSAISAYANSPYSVSSKTIFSNENVLYYVDFSIKYDLGSNQESRLFPIRIIDDSYLADVLNDWVLAPRMRTPVMVVYKDGASSAGDTDSVTGETVIKYDEHFKKRIQDLFTDFKYENNDMVLRLENGTELVPGGKHTIKTYQDGDIVYKPIKYLMRHKVTKKLYKLTSASGNTVIVTGDHSIMVERNGEIIPITVKELNTKTDKLIVDLL